MDSFNHTCHSVNVIYWLFDQSSMFSCFPACLAAVCISSLIKVPLGCRVHSGGIFIQRQRWAVCGGGTPVGGMKPKSHLMLIKDPEACLTRIFTLLLPLYAGPFSPCTYRASLFFDLNENELESESHLQMSKSLSAHLLVPNGKTAEMNGAPVRRSDAFMGCQLTTQPRNCWIMSFDDPVRLNRESLSRPCDAHRGCSVWWGLL